METSAPKSRILIADDDPDVRDVLETLLRNAGFDTVSVPNGAKALEVFDHDRCFDLVLLDMRMPVMTGLEALRALRDRPGPERNVGALMISANADAELIKATADLGIDGYVLKPFDNDKVLARVMQSLPQPLTLASVRSLAQQLHSADPSLLPPNVENVAAYPLLIGDRRYIFVVPAEVSRRGLIAASNREFVQRVAVLASRQGRWVHVWPRSCLFREFNLDQHALSAVTIGAFCRAS